MAQSTSLTPTTHPTNDTVNVALRLSHYASIAPDQTAIAMPQRRKRDGKRDYDTITFQELERETNRIASGLAAAGAKPGMRLILLVKPSIEFIELVFALLKSGVVIVLIDPGMGRKNLLRCLSDVKPDGFVAIPLGHAMRCLFRRRFPQARFNVTVGRRWFWGGHTLQQIRAGGSTETICASTSRDDPAAIIFTTGSTGPPKGVLYNHGNFDQQAEQIQRQYGIEPGELDVPGFPLFGLFNAAMGVTTVIPDMDFTRPAQVDPHNIVEAIVDWSATQSFGSPALWNVVGRHCTDHEVQLPTLRRVLSAGAPVPERVLQAMTAVMSDDGEMHTPYGATEALPVATISATEVLQDTAQRSAEGAGTCVGRRFAGIEWKVIRISDEPIAKLDDAEELPPGEIGEIIVQGPVVTTRYVTRTEANPLHKIQDGESFWHRMGDVGYLDDQDRFWFCGRKAHRLQTERGTLFTIPCEAIFNQHPAVFRSALVGVGVAPEQLPVIIVETEAKDLNTPQQKELKAELLARAAANPLTESIRELLFHPSFPVDIRHNSKIFREQLAKWASSELSADEIESHRNPVDRTSTDRPT